MIFSLGAISEYLGRAFKGGLSSSYADGPLSNFGGRNVNPSTALTISTVWACIRIISDSIASLPLNVYTKDSDGDKILQPQSNLYKILHDSPNADMTPMEYWQAVVASVLLRGNSFSLKTYRGNGRKTDENLVSIDPLRTDLMQLKLQKDGSWLYIYNDPNGIQEYTDDDIMHIKGMGVTGKVGLSVIQFARQTFSNSLALEDSATKLYQNGLHPGGALELPNVLKKEQREELRGSIANQLSTVSRTGGTIILEGGMKYSSLAITPDDAQLLESKGFSVEEICRWYGVPPNLVGHSEKNTSWGTGLEQINIGFLTYTLQPYLRRIEQAISKHLIAPENRGKIFAEFNIDGFLRADSTGRASLYSSASQNGWMTRAEIRKKENLPFKDGSDTLTVQSALVNLNNLDNVTNGANVTPESGSGKSLDIKNLDIMPPSKTLDELVNSL